MERLPLSIAYICKSCTRSPPAWTGIFVSLLAASAPLKGGDAVEIRRTGLGGSHGTTGEELR